MKTRVLVGLCAVLAFGVWVGSAAADPFVGPPICSATGTAISGTHHNLTITGNAYVASGTTLTVHGSLTLAPDACLDAFTMGTVTVTGNLLVNNGAILALGCTLTSAFPPTPCTGTTNDVVHGNILADHPWTMYLDGDTITGNVVSIGGGPGATYDPYVNFPIKDNVINGNLTLTGWQGAWFGFIRNTVHGNITITDNVAANSDGNEVATNTIWGNLICLDNTPGAQLGDSGGQPNTIHGHAIGECAGL